MFKLIARNILLKVPTLTDIPIASIQNDLPRDIVAREIQKTCFQPNFGTLLPMSYPCANDNNFLDVLCQLEALPPTPSRSTRVAFLVGESHILSALPEFSRHCDVVVLNDIDPRVNHYLKFLLNTFNKSETIEEFKKHFTESEEQNPLHIITKENVEKMKKRFGFSEPTPHGNTTVWNTIESKRESLERKYFLYSEERFSECKEAAKRISICLSNQDILHDDSLFEVLKRTDAHLTLVNTTNVGGDYCSKSPNKERFTTFVNKANGSQDVLFISSRNKDNMKAKLAQGPHLALQPILGPDLNKEALKRHIQNTYLIYKSTLKKPTLKQQHYHKQKYEFIKGWLNQVDETLYPMTNITPKNFELSAHLDSIVDAAFSHPNSVVIFKQLMSVGSRTLRFEGATLD